MQKRNKQISHHAKTNTISELKILIDSSKNREAVPSWEERQHTELTRSIWVTHKTKNEHPEFQKKLGQTQHTTRHTSTRFPQTVPRTFTEQNRLGRTVPIERKSVEEVMFEPRTPGWKLHTVSQG